jgi:hypothetical protein
MSLPFTFLSLFVSDCLYFKIPLQLEEQSDVIVLFSTQNKNTFHRLSEKTYY